MMKSKIEASLKLSAIGDALGWMTEFQRNSTDLVNQFGVEKIDRFYDWEKMVGGRYYGFIDAIKAGSYSDDTQLTLAIARSILSDGSIDNHRFSKLELSNWLYYARGGGRTIKTAASKIQRKSASWNNNFFQFKIGKQTIDYRDSGANGAAMRVLPIALANIGNYNKIKTGIFSNAIITHGHARAIIGAITYGAIIDSLFPYTTSDFDPFDFLTEFGKSFKDRLLLDIHQDVELMEWAKNWEDGWSIDFETHYNDIVEEVHHQLQNIFIALRDDTHYSKVLDALGCYHPSTKGSGTATVIGGLFLALKFYKEPSTAILNAVNSIGTDTDSIAGFTGGMVGVVHGTEAIIESWTEVQDIEYLHKVSDRLYQIQNRSYSSSNTIEASHTFKTINDFESDNLKENDTIYFQPLGSGKVEKIDRYPVLIEGKYALVVDINFEIGQSCRFSKVCSN